MTNPPTITPEYAMGRADAFGRRTYRGGLVSLRAYESVPRLANTRPRVVPATKNTSMFVMGIIDTS